MSRFDFFRNALHSLSSIGKPEQHLVLAIWVPVFSDLQLNSLHLIMDGRCVTLSNRVYALVYTYMNDDNREVDIPLKDSQHFLIHNELDPS